MCILRCGLHHGQQNDDRCLGTTTQRVLPVVCLLLLDMSTYLVLCALQGSLNDVVFVELTGKKVIVKGSLDAAFRILATNYCAQRGFSLAQQRFIYNRRQLDTDNRKTCRDGNMERGCCVHVVLRLCGD